MTSTVQRATGIPIDAMGENPIEHVSSSGAPVLSHHLPILEFHQLALGKQTSPNSATTNAASILQFPPELQLHVFALCEACSVIRLQQLSSVCKSWWQLIIANPTLWRHITVQEPLEHTALKLRKSGTAPLDVIVNFLNPDYESISAKVCDLLTLHVDHIASLHVSLSRRGGARFLLLPMPQLKYLRVIAGDGPPWVADHGPGEFMTGGMRIGGAAVAKLYVTGGEALEEIDAIGAALTLDKARRYPKVARIHISNIDMTARAFNVPSSAQTVDYILKLFQTTFQVCPNLQELRIFNFHTAAGDYRPGPSIALPKLRSLIISHVNDHVCNYILRSIEAANIDQLKIILSLYDELSLAALRDYTTRHPLLLSALRNGLADPLVLQLQPTRVTLSSSNSPVSFQISLKGPTAELSQAVQDHLLQPPFQPPRHIGLQMPGERFGADTIDYLRFVIASLPLTRSLVLDLRLEGTVWALKELGKPNSSGWPLPLLETLHLGLTIKKHPDIFEDNVRSLVATRAGLRDGEEEGGSAIALKVFDGNGVEYTGGAGEEVAVDRGLWFMPHRIHRN